MNQSRSIAETVLLAAVRELFQGAARATVDLQPESLSGRDVLVSTIGFGGSEMRGSITLMGTVATWRTLAPLASGVPSESDEMLCDMLGELVNMLAGRFRNAFLRLGVETLIATPVTTRGTNLDVRSTAGPTVIWHNVVSDGGPFRLRLDLSLAEGFDFAGREAEVVEPNEQELVLF